MLQAFAVAAGGAMKSIPLNQLPPEAWQHLSGTPAATSVLKLYNSVPWLYRGVNLIADAVGNMPWAYHDQAGAEVEDARLPFDVSLRDCLNTAAGDYVLYGAVYFHKGMNRLGVPTRLQRWIPTSVTPKIDADAGLTAFERRWGGQAQSFAIEDVAYLWYPNREAELGAGTPPAVVALKAGGLLGAIDGYGSGWFENGAQGVTLLFFEGSPNDTELARIDSWIQRRLTGLKNAGRTLGVRTKPDAVTLGETPDKMALAELTDKKREDVATGLGIPHSLLFSNAANFATARQDDIHFYTKTVTPLSERLGDMLTDTVFSRFGLTLKPHPERIELFQNLEAEKSQALALMRDRRAISINEYRDTMGFDTVDEPRYDALEPDRAGQPENSLQPEFMHAMGAADAGLVELRQWRQRIEKRLKAGKAIGRAFEAEHIEPVLKASIEGALEGADAESARHIFDDAARWKAYP